MGKGYLALWINGNNVYKLGQFLAARPDIIGEELSKKLENLQDRLPPFSIHQAKEIIRKDLGEVAFNSIINLSEPGCCVNSSSS